MINATNVMSPTFAFLIFFGERGFGCPFVVHDYESRGTQLQ